jgi:hypothetical protein
MSQICVATKTIVSILKFADFLGDVGVYEEAGWITPSSSGKRGNWKPLVTDSEEGLHAVLATLEECQAALVLGGDRDTAQLVSVAILELRIKLNRIEDSELKALCDAVLRDVEGSEPPHDARSHEGRHGRFPVLLKLVK